MSAAAWRGERAHLQWECWAFAAARAWARAAARSRRRLLDAKRERGRHKNDRKCREKAPRATVPLFRMFLWQEKSVVAEILFRPDIAAYSGLHPI
ncbi:MAG: hypothetical protein EOP82_19980 [Variovorax sp.]|nr:MAG: hypothetical protein EOP82_19980 [Variovorax sp.]